MANVGLFQKQFIKIGSVEKSLERPHFSMKKFAGKIHPKPVGQREIIFSIDVKNFRITPAKHCMENNAVE